MLAIVPSLLALLALTSSSHARDYVQFSGIFARSYDYGMNQILSSNPATQALCQASCDARTGCSAWTYYPDSETGLCYTFIGYPHTCSGWDETSSWTQGMIDRCQGTPGYQMGKDGTCIYTGGVAYSDAAYAQACPTVGTSGNAGAAAPLASPAYRKKRTVVAVEQSPFVGGKVCPIGEQACPLKKGFGCINVKENLNSCGGCIGGAGVDCSDIIGADEVACELGTCLVKSCTRGFSLSIAGQCVKA